MRYPQGAWDLLARVDAEETWLTAADGTRLNSWWFPRTKSQLATLFLHGNAGNVTHRIRHAEALRAAGFSVLLLDYRGYGKSSGRPSEGGLYSDAEAAYAALVRLRYAPKQIVLHGESLGTAVAVELASGKPCAGIVLESAFLSVSKMAGAVLPLLGPLLAKGFDTHAKIPRVHAPLLAIHGEADDIVPLSQGEAVFRRANEPKQFWRITGAGHNDLLETAGSEYVARLSAFYASLAR